MAFSPRMMNDVLSVFNLLKIDTESRGVISRNDAIHILKELGEENTDIVVNEIFNQHHHVNDKSFTISWIEFVKSISHVYKLQRLQRISIARRWFDYYDENKNGVLEREEIAKLVHNLLPNEKTNKIEDLCDQFFDEENNQTFSITWQQFISNKAVTSELLALMENEKWAKNEDDDYGDECVRDENTEDEIDDTLPQSNSDFGKNHNNIVIPSIILPKSNHHHQQSVTVPSSNSPKREEMLESVTLSDEPKKQHNDMLNVKTRLEELQTREAECYRKERNLQFVMESLRLKEDKLRRWERELHDREIALEKRERTILESSPTESMGQVDSTSHNRIRRNSIVTNGGVMLSAITPRINIISQPNNAPSSPSVVKDNSTRRQTVFYKAMNFFKKKEIDSAAEETSSPRPSSMSSTSPNSSRGPLSSRNSIGNLKKN